MARLAIASFLLAFVIGLTMFQTSAYAHPIHCGIACGPAGPQGSHPPPEDPFIRFLMPLLGMIGSVAFIGSMVFGILVLIKNRARKIAC